MEASNLYTDRPESKAVSVVTLIPARYFHFVLPLEQIIERSKAEAFIQSVCNCVDCGCRVPLSVWEENKHRCTSCHMESAA